MSASAKSKEANGSEGPVVGRGVGLGDGSDFVGALLGLSVVAVGDRLGSLVGRNDGVRVGGFRVRLGDWDWLGDCGIDGACGSGVGSGMPKSV
jgi:hypothetical protein